MSECALRRGFRVVFRSASHALRLVLLLASVGMPSLALGGKGAEPAETDEFAFDEEKGGGDAYAVCPAEACWTPKPWVRAEYLLWWIDGFDAPPLATTSPVGTDRDLAGQLDQLSTSILLGGQTLTNDASSGGRIRFGLWLDAGSTCGVEASYLGLGRNRSAFQAGSPLPSILARPFTNLESGFEGADAELIAYPGLFDGSLQIRRETELQGVEVLYRQALSRSCRLQIDWLAGWRFNRLDEDLLISDFKRSLAENSGLRVGTTVQEYDHFATSNQFHGGQLGIIAQGRCCRWSWEATGKLALGNNRTEVAIDGSTTVTVPIPGAPPDMAVTPAGLLAQSTNSGLHSKDVFAVVPELGVTVGYQLTARLRATFGYTFLYWSQVARPGDQIDLDVNPSQLTSGGLVGAPRPEFHWIGSDMWAQGMNFGLDYRF